MKCSCERCGLSLPRGAAHVSPEGCIEALQEALEKSRTCASCGDQVPTVIHAGCVPAEVVNRGAKLGTGIVEQRIKEWLLDKATKRARGAGPESEGSRFEP